MQCSTAMDLSMARSLPQAQCTTSTRGAIDVRVEELLTYKSEVLIHYLCQVTFKRINVIRLGDDCMDLDRTSLRFSNRMFDL